MCVELLVTVHLMPNGKRQGRMEAVHGMLKARRQRVRGMLKARRQRVHGMLNAGQGGSGER